MAFVVEQEQRTMVLHRENFVGRPSPGNTVTWDYEGRSWLVKRPDDGSPAVRRSVSCPVCEKSLTFTVHSIAATRGRRTRRWIWAASGAAVAVIAPFTLLIIGVGAVRLTAALVIAALGFMFAYLAVYVAVRETGFTGHGVSWPIIPKHMAALPQQDPHTGRIEYSREPVRFKL